MTDEQYNSIMAELAEIKRRLPKQETTIRGTLTRDAEMRLTTIPQWDRRLRFLATTE